MPAMPHTVFEGKQAGSKAVSSKDVTRRERLRCELPLPHSVRNAPEYSFDPARVSNAIAESVAFGRYAFREGCTKV